MENQIDRYRKEIDQLDFKILDCLAISGKEMEILLECTVLSTRSLTGGVQQRTHTGSGESTGTQKEPPRAKRTSYRSLTGGWWFLFEKRKNLVKKMGLYKKKMGISAVDREREEDIFKTRKAYGKKRGLAEQEVEDLFARILDDSHEIIQSIFHKEK